MSIKAGIQQGGLEVQSSAGASTFSVSDAGQPAFQVDAATMIATFTSFSDTATVRPILGLRHARGSLASPTQTKSGDTLGGMLGYGYNSGSWYSQGGWQLYATTDTTTTGGCRIVAYNGASGASMGEVDLSTGAWTLGPASGLSTSHKVRAGLTIVSTFDNTAANVATIQINGTTNSVQIGHNAGQAFIQGIFGQTSSSGSAVYVNSNNLLGTSTSVREAKTNIQPLGSTIGWLKQLKPYVYQYRKQVDGKYTDEAEDFVNTGLIYDEVVQVNPQLCFDTAEGKPSGVEYTRLITPLLKAFQEQQAMIEQANLAIEALQAKVAALEAK